MEHTTEYLKCLLDDLELRDTGISLARHNSKVASLEAEKKAFNDQIKAQITAAEAEILRLSGILQNGYEYRQVEITIDRDYDEKIIRIIRQDTGEIVREEKMTADDLQVSAFEDFVHDCVKV